MPHIRPVSVLPDSEVMLPLRLFRDAGAGRKGVYQGANL